MHLKLVLAGELRLLLLLVPVLAGGSAFAATSTRSRFFENAYSRASSVALIPICVPSESTRRTRGTRMLSLMRDCATTGRTGSNARRDLNASSPNSS
jgi:hypothetical protein